MAESEKQIKLSVHVDALKVIDKQCRKKGMTRSEFLVRAGLAFCDGVGIFTSQELDEIREVVKQEIKNHEVQSHG